jgi:hypothetical protein
MSIRRFFETSINEFSIDEIDELQREYDISRAIIPITTLRESIDIENGYLRITDAHCRNYYRSMREYLRRSSLGEEIL